MATLLLIALFFLTIGHLVTLKVCSLKLDHRTAPVFVSSWTLLGVALVFPFYGHLWQEGWEKFQAYPPYIALAGLKGAALYYLFVTSQELMKVSLSSRHYVTPLAVGLMTVSNYFLGEALKPQQWVAALGLFGVSVAFFFKGHLSEMSKDGKISYFKLVFLSVVLAGFDQVLTKEINWYAYLLVSNLALLALSLLLIRADKKVLRDALFHTSAIWAGAFYAATELVKFYQQVSINPVTVVVMAQALTKPVILVLSALVWKERTVKEQLVFGALAFLFVTLPLLYDALQRGAP